MSAADPLQAPADQGLAAQQLAQQTQQRMESARDSAQKADAARREAEQLRGRS